MNETTKQNNGLLPNGYDLWRKDIEALIDTAKLQTAINVNQGMLSLYWSIGKQILDKQEKLGWGKQIISQLSKDLSLCYPGDRGYSERNLRNMKRFASEYPDFPFLQVPLAKFKESTIWQVALAKLGIVDRHQQISSCFLSYVPNIHGHRETCGSGPLTIGE